MNQPELAYYGALLGDIKARVRPAQTRAALSANAEMILMYWDIERMISARLENEGWGTGVIPRLAVDLKNELPEEKGFSERNIKRMLTFYREHPNLAVIVPRPAALLTTQAPSTIPTQLAFGIPWFHHVILIEKIKDLPTRFWYARQTVEHGWTRDTLIAEVRELILSARRGVASVVQTLDIGRQYRQVV